MHGIAIAGLEISLPGVVTKVVVVPDGIITPDKLAKDKRVDVNPELLVSDTADVKPNIIFALEVPLGETEKPTSTDGVDLLDIAPTPVMLVMLTEVCVTPADSATVFLKTNCTE